MAYSELAFQFAKELSTQLITISSALIGVSVTFIKDLKTDEARWLRISSGLYIVGIVFGVWHLMALTGTLESLSAPGATFGTFKPNTQIPVGGQILSFVAGTIFLFVFAWKHWLKRD